jgi:hypothetical protein
MSVINVTECLKMIEIEDFMLNIFYYNFSQRMENFFKSDIRLFIRIMKDISVVH